MDQTLPVSLSNVLVNGVIRSNDITELLLPEILTITTLILLILASGGLEISGTLVPGPLGITVPGSTVLGLLDNTGSLV